MFANVRADMQAAVAQAKDSEVRRAASEGATRLHGAAARFLGLIVFFWALRGRRGRGAVRCSRVFTNRLQFTYTVLYITIIVFLLYNLRSVVKSRLPTTI